MAEIAATVRGRGLLRRALAVLPVVTVLHAPQSRGEVIDDIAVEQRAGGATVRLHLVSPVHYLRDYLAPDGRSINVYLQALAPEDFPGTPPVDEVRHSPRGASGLRFAVRVSLDPRCDPAPHPVCLVISFEQRVGSSVRLGDDRRSLLLDLASEGGRIRSPVRDKP